jgi:phosphoribosylformylglycinamidine cyclo-ligase
MGAGFAIYVPEKEVDKVLSTAKKLGLSAWDSGIVETGPKQVIIKPKNVTFSGKSLAVR